MIKNVLITGGAGFIGLHLANRLLDNGYHVMLMDNFARGVKDKELQETLERKNVTIAHIDVLDEKPVLELGNDFDVICHLAAIIGVAHVMQRPYNVLYDNVRMLGNMISLARKQNQLSRFLFASTSEVYAGTLRYFALPIPTPEDSPLTITELDHPRTSYMLSKIYGEAMCQQAGIPFSIIRPHNVYGPRMGMSHVIPELCEKARNLPNNAELEVYSVTHKRTFCYVSDAIEELHCMIEADQCAGHTFNLGNQTPEIEIGELARKILKVVGREDLTIKAMPATPGSPPRRGPDMKKTNAFTGYEAKIGLEEGVAKTYEWYVKNVFEGHGVSAK